jgi:hypothetical protein
MCKACKYVKLLKALPSASREIICKRVTPSLAFAVLIPPKLRSLGFYPRILKSIDGFKFYLNDYATLAINVPDQYLRR